MCKARTLRWPKFITIVPLQISELARPDVATVINSSAFRQVESYIHTNKITVYTIVSTACISYRSYNFAVFDKHCINSSYEVTLDLFSQIVCWHFVT